MNNNTFDFIQNYPIKVNMYGCRGDIYTLRAAGWDISIQCEHSIREVGYIFRICGKHRETKALLISEQRVFDLDFENYNMLAHVELAVVAVAGQITINGEFDYSRFRAFTGTHPEFVQIKREDFNPHKIPFFSDALANTELIIPDKSIDELLQELLDKQEPKQAELRAKRLELKRKAAKGEHIEDNLLYLPNATRKIELITVGA